MQTPAKADDTRCEKCGSCEFETRWQGLTYEFRCARCHWGAVTTQFPPIKQDTKIYKIVITSLGADPNRSLIVLNRRFGHGVAQTRAMFSAGERELFTGAAWDLWREARALRSEQVPFRIEPEFPYDLASYDAERGHEHDWTPIKLE